MHSKQKDIKSLKRSATRDVTEAAIKSLHEKKISAADSLLVLPRCQRRSNTNTSLNVPENRKARNIIKLIL